MTQNVGDIEYVIKADTAQLLRADKQVRHITDGMEGGFNRADKAASSLTSSFGSLSRVATSLMAILSVQQVSQYADAWTTLNNKLANALRPSERLVDVTERVFNITQQTRGSLDATASLYARLERATREYGTSADDLAKLTTIINQGFVVSGATAQEAENAIIQLSQGLASGALRGEEFNSVNEQGNRLIVALADSMGVSVGEMRSMAAAGKLTTDVVVNGLLSQGAEIGSEFANTTTTISQALQVAGNNITKFFGENSSVKTGAAIFNDAVVTVSENIGILSGALTAVAAVMGSRYVGALTLSAAAQASKARAIIQDIAATRQQAKEELVAASALQKKIALDKQAALTTLQRAENQYVLAKGSLAEATAYQNLIRLRGIYIGIAAEEVTANNAVAASQARVAATGVNLANGYKALKLATAPLGGPTGAIMLAATAVYYFYQKVQQAKQESIDFADSLDGLTAKMKEMSSVQIASAIAKTEQSIIDQQDAIASLRAEYEQLEQKKTFIEQAAQIRGTAAVADDLAEANRNLAVQADKVEQAENKLSRTTSSLGLLRAQANGQFREGIDLLRRDGEEAGVAAGMMGKLGDMINFAARAKENFNSSSLMVMRSEDGDKLLSSLEKQNALLSVTDKRERAVAEARQAALDAGVDVHSNQMRQIEEAAAKRYDLQQADSAVTKSTKEGSKAVDEAAQSLAHQQAALDRLNTGYSDSSLELAKYDAVVALGNKASAEQIAKAEQQAESIWKIQQATKAAADEEKKRTQAGQNFTNLQGQASPVAAVDNAFAQQMAQLDEYARLYPQRIAEAEAVRAGIEEQYRQKRMAAMWEEWQQQSEINNMLGAAIDSLQGGATNAITGLINGTQSLQESFANIGTTILNSVVGSLVQMGIEWVKNQLIAQSANAAAATSAAATGASITASMAPAAAATNIATMGQASTVGMAAMSAAIPAMVGLFGGRRYGGGVSAGNAYRINENGRSEIFQTAGGQQMFIPNQSGKVISADKAGGGGGVVQHITFEINTTGGIDDATMAKMAQMMKQVSLNTIRDQQRPNGLLRR
ncbi:tape measure protein [Salmonella enterica subsp. enterica serovar Hartford]|uniref:tape measure protein n=1 Tax=Salmonella enterica TaxID=28901 RepID=UPI000E0B94AD|nr:tape measure protein [Salmonella enterica]EDQ9499947.1 tape measure protein [Salmonella enterica subsp. enterica serovar Hartford]EDR0327438.1 tape measure protein [Salmonella enterica subsp. enterica serovar Hartford]EDW1443972.1 tape measure protein [Salmonella enterica subsp. enterica serovar Hartford]EGJ3101687.1 tape measure protein [Salmonella enterica subsp. enterica serovar Hartford]EGJ3115011.1 tape measure protein [Salmonella enterica subsp. enterica serovar Hartford]